MMTVLEPPFASGLAILSCFISWLTAQLIKVIIGVNTEKRFNFRWLFDTGGMPSAHSATVASLTLNSGLYYGFTSLPFLIVGIFSMITMFDAAGVRRNVGRQAEILNKMLDEFSTRGEIEEQRVKELLGHTPVEVFAGASLGLAIVTLFNLFIY